jgi:hypothetical protein
VALDLFAGAVGETTVRGGSTQSTFEPTAGSSEEGHDMADQHDEIVEPPNSTVNDWHGQKVSDDEEMIDEVLEETDGDVEAAERAFDERSADNDPARDISRPKPT